MKFPFNANKKRKADEKQQPIYVGQVSQVSPGSENININIWKAENILANLKQLQNKYDAVDFIVDNTPDGKMALNTYLRLINQGLDIELVDRSTGKVTHDYDVEMREFCATKMGGTTSNGLDGLLDQLYTSEILHGGMAVEVVVGKGAKEIEEIIVIDPKTITEFKWLPEKKRYAAYQQMGAGEKRDLYDGNFFWIPHQPKPGRPDGTLQFEPAINTLTQFYQTLKDISVVLYRIGFPKYVAKINMERLLADVPPDIKADEKKRADFLNRNLEDIKVSFANVGRDSSFVFYDCIDLDTIGGGVNGSGVDIRAAIETYDPLIVNSFQLTPVLMGRLKSGSYSLGTAEYKIAKDTMEVFRRSSKRMIENILNIWARVSGINVFARVTHRPIEWQVEMDKYKAQLLRMEKARRAEEYRYTDHEGASNMALENEANAQKEIPNLYEYINKYISDNPKEQSNEQEDEKPVIEEETKEEKNIEQKDN